MPLGGAKCRGLEPREPQGTPGRVQALATGSVAGEHCDGKAQATCHEWPLKYLRTF